MIALRGFAISLLAALPAFAAELSFRNTAPGIGYVGSRVCAGCHMDVYRSFRKTDMGRSASRLPDPAQADRARTPATVFNKKLNRYFRAFSKGPDLYQSEYQLAVDGSEVFRNTQKLEYVFGALENGDTYAVRRGNALYEAPLTYYRALNGWDLSPGYQDFDSGFNRPVALACASCHAGRPRPAPGSDGVYLDPAFSELAIGCENCHGPGQLHVAERAAQKPAPLDYDSAIVNPAKLPLRLADNVCMACHEAGAVRIIHPGRTLLDFRPGAYLDDTVSIFASAKNTESSSDSTQVLSHYQAMVASKCYRTSGKLACITCHDPHTQPADPVAFYKSKCLTCHTEASCKAPHAARIATTPADSCIGCHMPAKPTTTISHSALTDHRITATRNESMPPPLPNAFTSSTGLVHLDATPANDSVSPLLLVRAYTEMLQTDGSLTSRWLDLIGELVRTGKADPYTEVQAGSYLLQRGSPEERPEGKRLLAHAVDAGTELSGAYLVLANALAQERDVQSALAVVAKGLAIDPSNPNLYRTRVNIYAVSGDYAKAEAAASSYLAEFPQDAEMRESLRTIQGLAAKGGKP